MTDNWQEKMVEELAKEACGSCQSGIPMYVRPCYEQDERWHESPGKLVQCYANRPGLREAIRRTLEKAAETFDGYPTSDVATCLRQMAGKED